MVHCIGFPNGESGADVYDRVSTFMETLHRDMDTGLHQVTPFALINSLLVVVMTNMMYIPLIVHVFSVAWYNMSRIFITFHAMAIIHV
jgi:broad specificity phosphatase PhoE